MIPDFSRHYLLDGATGTRLFAAGMPRGVCPESWVLEHRDVMERIQRSYIDAGSDVLYTPTFGANSARLSSFGLEGGLRDMNARLVDISRRASGGRALLAGDVSTAGAMPEPFGDTPFSDLVGIYAEQALALKEAGVDYVGLETFMSLTDARAAFLGARQAGLPVTVTMTADEHGRTFMGSSVLAALVTFQAMGAAAFGLNCSEGPEPMLPVIKSLAPHAAIPLIVKPNAGLPAGEPPRYDMTPEEFSAQVRLLLDAGASIAGGCCGTQEGHIKALRGLMDGYDWARPLPERKEGLVLASDTGAYFLEEDFELSEEIECETDMSDALLDAEDEAVDALSIRIRSFDDAYHFALNAHMAHLPVSFLADGEEELENALFYYPGRAMIDSRSDVDEDKQRELAAGYGAVIV